MDEKYAELIGKAAADYASAAAAAREKNVARMDAQGELERLVGEQAALRERLGQFEAGLAGVTMTAEEYQTAQHRLAWLAGMINGQQRIVAAAAATAEAAGRAVVGVHTQARARLEEMLKADIAAMQAARRSELEAVLRG